MSLLTQLMKASWQQILTSLLLSMISAGLNVMLIYQISQAIAGKLTVSAENTALFFGLVLLSFFSGIVTQRILGKLGIEVVASLRKSLSGRALSTDYGQLEHLGKARIYTSLVDDIHTIYITFTTVPILTFNVFLVFGGILYLGFLSLPYLAIFLLLLMVAVILIYAVSSRIDRAFLLMRNSQEELHRDFHTLTDGSRELCISQARRHHFFHRVLNASITKTKQHALQGEYHTATLNNVMSLIVYMIFGCLIFVAQFFIPASAEILSGFLVTLMFIRNPVGITIDSIPVLLRAQHAFDKMQQLELTTEPDWINTHDAPAAAMQGDALTLAFEQVCYSYPGVNGEAGFAVGPLQFTASSGELIFIVGGNGSGKSTFGKLLTALYPATQGQLRLNGQVIDDEHRRWYQNQLSVVFSDFYLFDFIVDGQGCSRYDQQVDIWLEKLKLQDKLKVDQHGQVSTLKLSHGQRKRLALLAAYLEEKPIILFDEWAADQDPSFRDFFYHQVLPMLKAQGKILFVISHDEHYFHLADRIYKMEDGQMQLWQGSPLKKEDVVLYAL
jgi:cyclic peptide transporter